MTATAKVTKPGTIFFWRTSLVRERATEELVKVRGPEDAADYLRQFFADVPNERFVVLIMNTQHRVVGVHVVTEVIVDASLVHPREVFRSAIIANGAAIIVAHNHPSGDPTPSHEDRVMTKQLNEAGKAVGIKLLDSLVVCHDGSWRSIRVDNSLDFGGIPT